MTKLVLFNFLVFLSSMTFALSAGNILACALLFVFFTITHTILEIRNDANFEQPKRIEPVLD